MEKADIGLIGLAVMGQNLVLNMADHGFRVAVFNRTTSKVDEFLDGPAKESSIIGTHSMEELVASLTVPRKVMLMVKAGEVVDHFIEMLIPLLEPGDVIIEVIIKPLKERVVALIQHSSERLMPLNVFLC